MSIPLSRDPEEARELGAALAESLKRGLARQYDTFDELAKSKSVSSTVEPTVLRAHLSEFLPRVESYLLALVPPSPRVREGIWHAIEVTIGGRPGIAVFLVRSPEELAEIEKRLKET